MSKQFILHQDALSANCYKIKLTAALLDIPLEKRNYSILEGDTQTPEFQANVSFWRRIPVLQVGESSFLPESNASCFYLAEYSQSLSKSQSSASLLPRYNLIPEDPFRKATMLRWMFFEQNNHEICVGTLRFWLHILGEEKLSADRVAQIPGKKLAVRECFDHMQDHLANRTTSGWFVGESITLADICLFAYTHLVDNAGFDLNEWPAIKAWCERLKSVDGFIPFDLND